MIREEVAYKKIRRLGALIDKLESQLEKDPSLLTKLPSANLVKAHVDIRDRLKQLVIDKNQQIKYYNEKKNIKENKKDERSDG